MSETRLSQCCDGVGPGDEGAQNHLVWTCRWKRLSLTFIVHFYFLYILSNVTLFLQTSHETHRNEPKTAHWRRRTNDSVTWSARFANGGKTRPRSSFFVPRIRTEPAWRSELNPSGGGGSGLSDRAQLTASSTNSWRQSTSKQEQHNNHQRANVWARGRQLGCRTVRERTSRATDFLLVTEA